MNVRFYPGHCEDCHNNSEELLLCEPPLVPEGISAELCGECIAARREEHLRGEEPRMIGLTPTGINSVWVDLQPLKLSLRDGRSVGEIAVMVRYRRPNGRQLTSENGGEVKLMIGATNRWVWADFLAPEIFGYNPHKAIVTAESALRVMMEERGVSSHHVQIETTLA